MGAGADAIGSVSVKIVGDASSLQSSFTAATQSATKAGETIGNSFNAAAIKQATLQLSVDTLRQKYDALAATGVRTAAAQQQMENVAARLDIANMKLSGSLNQVAASADKVSHSMVTGQQATSGFIRVAEGSSGLRAVENFLAKTLGLGPAMQAIFPIVGALAFGEILFRIGSELSTYIEKMRQFGTASSNAFNALNSDLQISNDELQIANDRLEMAIGKLSGHPSNGIKTLIDEAELSADNLEKKLVEILDKIDKAHKDIELTTAGGIIRGQAPTAPLTQQFAKSDAQAKLDIDQITRETNAKIRAAQAVAEAATTGADKKRALDEADAARTEQLTRLQGVLGRQYYEASEVRRKAAEDQAKQDKILQQSGFQSGVSKREGDLSGPYQAEVIKAATARQEQIRQAADILTASYKQGSLQQQKTIAELAKEESEAQKKADAEKKKAAEDALKGWKDVLEDSKLNSVVSINDETSYWQEKLAIAQKGGKPYLDIVRTIQADLIRLRGEGIEANKRANEEDLKLLDERIKNAQEAAEESGQGHPAAIKTQMLTEALTVTTPEVDTGKQQSIQQRLNVAEKEQRAENLADLKKFLSESDAAWEASGYHTAEQAQARYNAVAKAYKSTQAVFDEYSKKAAAETPKIIADTEKLAAGQSAIQTKSAGQVQTSALDQKKLTLEQDYAAAITHTISQQNDYAEALAAIENQRLEIKLREAGLAHEEAEDIVAELPTVENILKMEEARLKVDEARAALRLQQQKAEGEAAGRAKSQDIGTQIISGFGNTINSSMNSLTKAITDLVTQSKGWGKEFDKALKQAEHGAVSSIVGAILKKVEDEGKTALKDTLGNTSGQPGSEGHLGTFGQKLGDILFPKKPPNPDLLANTAAHKDNTAKLATLTPAITSGTTAEQQNTTELAILDEAIRELIAALLAKAQGPIGGPLSGAVGAGKGGGLIVGPAGGYGGALSPGSNGGTQGTAVGSAIDYGEGKQDLGSTITPGTPPPPPLPKPPPTPPAGQGALGALGQLLPGIAGLATAILGSTAGQKQHGLVVDLLRAATLANSAVTVANTIATILNTYVPKPLGFAGGGDPDTDRPFLAGEKGPELIHPKGQSLTVIPAGKTKQMMDDAASRLNLLSSPQSFTPDVPGSIIPSHSVGGGASYMNTVTNNSNVGNFGNNHYHIYGAQNPREIMRQISDFEKRQTGKYSPANS